MGSVSILVTTVSGAWNGYHKCGSKDIASLLGKIKKVGVIEIYVDSESQRFKEQRVVSKKSIKIKLDINVEILELMKEGVGNLYLDH